MTYSVKIIFIYLKLVFVFKQLFLKFSSKSASVRHVYSTTFYLKYFFRHTCMCTFSGISLKCNGGRPQQLRNFLPRTEDGSEHASVALDEDLLVFSSVLGTPQVNGNPLTSSFNSSLVSASLDTRTFFKDSRHQVAWQPSHF